MLDLQGYISVKSDQELSRIYSGLEALAESGVPTEDIVELIDVGSQNFRAFFRDELLEGLIIKGGSTCRFFGGAYGTGKTHLIRLLEKDCQKTGLATVRIDISRTLNLEDWSAVTRYILENITFRVRNHEARGLDDVLYSIRESPDIRIDSLEKASLPHPGFKAAMVRRLKPIGISPTGLEDLNRFLRGDRVTIKNLRAGGVNGVKNPLSQSNGEYVLNTVISGLYELGLPGTAVFFDENERTFAYRGSKPPRRIVDAANHMRHFIDACFNEGIRGMLGTFTVLRGFLERCAEAYPALGHRLQVDSHASDVSPRWPVLQLNALYGPEPEDFLKDVSERLCGIVQCFDSDDAGLLEEMWAIGLEVLEVDAGPGYRRPLLKTLARTALERITFKE